MAFRPRIASEVRCDWNLMDLVAEAEQPIYVKKLIDYLHKKQVLTSQKIYILSIKQQAGLIKKAHRAVLR